jgi:hypothetical protein
MPRQELGHRSIETRSRPMLGAAKRIKQEELPCPSTAMVFFENASPAERC